MVDKLLKKMHKYCSTCYFSVVNISRCGNDLTTPWVATFLLYSNFKHGTCFVERCVFLDLEVF